MGGFFCVLNLGGLHVYSEGLIHREAYFWNLTVLLTNYYVLPILDRK